MEAFVLWDHPTLGRLTLPEFEAAAEAAGLSGELWAYIFERCIRQGARWHRILQRDDPLYVSINMTSQQLFHHDLVQNLRLIIGRETLPKGALRLEIAESLINSNPEQAIEIIDWLKSLNVSVALDEFGVSFSSLSYWHRLSIDAIKIDRSLVALSDKERSSAMVLKAVLTIAHELGKDVVAVGVDSEEDLAYVRARRMRLRARLLLQRAYERARGRASFELHRALGPPRRPGAGKRGEARRAQSREGTGARRRRRKKGACPRRGRGKRYGSRRSREEDATAAENAKRVCPLQTGRSLNRAAQARKGRAPTLLFQSPRAWRRARSRRLYPPRSPAAPCFHSAAEKSHNWLSIKRAAGGNCNAAGITLDRRAFANYVRKSLAPFV